MAEIQGVILAGGISSRMGFPKALMPIGGNSFFLLEIYRCLREAGATPVHVVINSGLRFSLEAQMEKFPDARFALNQAPAKGQIHSLQIGLQQAAADGAGAALVTLVDLPMVKSSTAAKLIQASSSHLGKMLVPRYNGEHGHPFLVPRDKFPAFTEAMEGKTARDILHEHASSVEYIDVDDPAILADVDTLEDLARFSKAPDSEDMD